MSLSVDLPEPTKKRMIQLLQILKSWSSEKITSMAISNATGWKDSLIRHDLWLVGFGKGVSNGYYVKELIESLTQILGLELEQNAENQTSVKRNCCIVGLGRLGAALLDETLVDGSPFVIKAGFDSNVNRVEILHSTFPLYPASEMDWVIKREKIEYAILTVQDSSAQQMHNRLVKAGIKGIVNMTNVVLTVPDGVKIENLSIVNALKMVI